MSISGVHVVSPAARRDLSTAPPWCSAGASSSQSPPGWRTAWGFSPEDCGSSLRNTSWWEMFTQLSWTLVKSLKLTLRKREEGREMLEEAALLKHTDARWELQRKSYEDDDDEDSRSEERRASRRSETAAAAGRSSADAHDDGNPSGADGETRPSEICSTEEVQSSHSCSAHNKISSFCIILHFVSTHFPLMSCKELIALIN